VKGKEKRRRKEIDHCGDVGGENKPAKVLHAESKGGKKGERFAEFIGRKEKPREIPRSW